MSLLLSFVHLGGNEKKSDSCAYSQALRWKLFSLNFAWCMCFSPSLSLSLENVEKTKSGWKECSHSNESIQLFVFCKNRQYECTCQTNVYSACLSRSIDVEQCASLPSSLIETFRFDSNDTSRTEPAIESDRDSSPWPVVETLLSLSADFNHMFFSLESFQRCSSDERCLFNRSMYITAERL